MIFSVGDHVEQIKRGTKTQTRRGSDRYEIGKLYAIQPKRTAKGILEGKIEIIRKMREIHHMLISPNDAKAEGGYTQAEFEELYEKMHPNWYRRFAYTFKFVPTPSVHKLSGEEGVKGET